jgi:HEAT repeat protein
MTPRTTLGRCGPWPALALAGGLLCASACFSAGVPAELRVLVDEYTAQKAKLHSGSLDERRKRAAALLKPVLMKIARLDTPEGLAFLAGEFERESPEVASACVEPLLASSSEKAPLFLLSGFGKRPGALKQEILAGLRSSKRALGALEPALTGLLQSEGQVEIRRELPALLGRIDTPGAARALLMSLRPPGPRQKPKEAEAEEDYRRRVVAALKATRSQPVKDWLAGEAFAGASSQRFIALATLAAELKLEPARKELEKGLDHLEEPVALHALDALIRLGAAPSSARIAEGLKRGRRSVSFRVQALDALAASGSEPSLAALREAAHDGDPETRAIALGSLALVPGASEPAFQEILTGLKDADPSVRASAIRALARIRHKEMVPALIEMMRVEKEEKLKVDVLRLLLDLTDKNMGLVAEDWRKWWEVAGPVFEFPKGEKKVTAARSHDLKYFGIEVGSKRLAFLLDASGSMLETVDVYQKEAKTSAARSEPGKTQPAPPAAGEKEQPGRKTKARKIDVLKKELARVIGELPRDTHLNMVTFSGVYKAWQDTLQPLSGGGRERALAFVKDITTAHGTNVFDTLEFTLRDKRVDTIFLLTDGLPTKGRFIDGPSILREVRALNRVRGVVIHCVAFGAESPFLKDLAKENGGVYRFVNSY